MLYNTFFLVAVSHELFTCLLIICVVTRDIVHKAQQRSHCLTDNKGQEWKYICQKTTTLQNNFSHPYLMSLKQLLQSFAFMIGTLDVVLTH